MSHAVHLLKPQQVRIVLADDDPEDLELIGEALVNVEPSAELHKFNNGLSACQYLLSRPDSEMPCLIVLDYNMPRLNGAEVLSSIGVERRYDNVPKIVLSTSNAVIHQTECLTRGATEYIVKPSSFKKLREVAEKIIAFCR